MALALACILAEAARRHPERTALIAEGRRIGYRDLWEEARAYAAVLRDRGVRPGDRVAMMLPNVPDFPRVYYAVLALGAVVVPIHALLTAGEVAYLLRDSGATLMVCAGPLLPAGLRAARETGIVCLSVLAPEAAADGDLTAAARALEPIADFATRDPQDDAVVLYTSGTTGAPKGAVLTQNNLVLNATVGAFDLFPLHEDDVYFGALPLFHSFGQSVVMNTAFRLGASVALLPRFDGAAALDLLAGAGVTIFAGVPTMYVALLEAFKKAPRQTSLRVGLSGGASLPLAVLEEFEARFGSPVYEGYGLSETSPVASFNQICFGRKPGTVGRGIWGVELAIARPEIEERIEFLPDGELGEIVIRGHAVFKGYLNQPDATRAALVDGWFRSGDLGTRDSDGFITVVDRKKDMILRGGFNVYPREVEEVLMRHPAVSSVSVIGVPHPTHGEDVAAVVVLAAEAAIEAAALIEWSQQYLARYKYPRRVHFVDALPLGPSGKVLKRELRARFG
ncbi:MAG TPA: long-chain fatty acid--CoA ligase [Candidatus Acidoferrales bacterium]|nr:long-chain fatty acid--CoA ligase [Candidatus Acidoferrales bacterium]